MSEPILRKVRVLGAPVSCLSLPCDSLCLYGQGGWLERASSSSTDSLLDDDRILALDSESIHGIRYSTNQEYAVVFGTNFLSFIKHVLDSSLPMKRMKIVQDLVDRQNIKETSESLVVSDWVWDCEWMSQNTLAVGLAHNCVQIWEFEPSENDTTFIARCIREIGGRRKTITYCMHIYERFVAVGLPFSDILVWSIDDPSKEACLQGHKGGIHVVKFKSNDVLASGSDDRTIRLWQRTDYGNWTHKWTARGHTSRCWGLAFSDLGVVSTGEDSTARLWDERTGVELAVYRGHACQSIRRVDVCGALAVTGANDGSIAMFDLRHGIIGKHPSRTCDMHSSIASNASNHSWADIFAVPSDYNPPVLQPVIPADDLNERPPAMIGKLNQKGVVGMAFRFQAAKSRQLLVATHSGAVHCLDLTTGVWKMMCSWWVPSKSGIVRPGACEGCYFSVCPSGVHGLVGTKQGDVIVVNLHKRTEPRLLATMENKTIQRLVWLSSASFLSLHVQTVTLWRESVKKLGADFEPAFEPITVFRPGTKGIPACCAVDIDEKRLLIGDTRGYIALFDISGSHGDVAQSPISTIRPHGRQHVTNILWVNEKILSVGNDGCLTESYVLANNMLATFKSVQILSYTALDRIWATPGNHGPEVFVGGYYGNVYSVTNVETSYELFRADTGGRQRGSHMFFDSMDAGKNDSSCWLAVPSMHNGDKKEILLFRNRTLAPRYKWNSTVVPPMHGEVIFDSCLFVVAGDILALVTASEDRYARVTLIKENTIIQSTLLPSQDGGVKALSCCRFSARRKTFLVAGGGKMELHFYLVHDVSSETNPLVVEHLGYGRSPDKASIDHRINAVAVEELHEDVALVVAGDSSGRVVFYELSKPKDDCKSWRGTVLYLCDRPVISLAFVRTPQQLLLLIGSTAGDVTLLDVTEESLRNNRQCPVLLAYDAHQQGTNAISATHILSESGTTVLRICSGGDDQSIHVCEHILDHSVEGTIHLHLQNGGSSAIRALALTGANNFVTTGYDRGVRLWDVANDKGIQCLSCLPVVTGDVHCLSHAIYDNSHVFTVAGAGIEFFAFSAKE